MHVHFVSRMGAMIACDVKYHAADDWRTNPVSNGLKSKVPSKKE